MQPVSLYCNLLLLLYFTPLTWQISIPIPLSVSVYGDVRIYCSLSLLLLHRTHYYLPFFFSRGASTVSLTLFCPFSLCLLLYRAVALTLFSFVLSTLTEKNRFIPVWFGVGFSYPKPPKTTLKHPSFFVF